MPLYLKKGPFGFCKRCEQKFYLSELQEDGQQQGLMVCSECFDPWHPQQDPVHISSQEGVLEFTSPPTNGDNVVVRIGGHVELSSLQPIFSVPFQFTSNARDYSVVAV